jgi:hypothetical protein
MRGRACCAFPLLANYVTKPQEGRVPGWVEPVVVRVVSHRRATRFEVDPAAVRVVSHPRATRFEVEPVAVQVVNHPRATAMMQRLS